MDGLRCSQGMVYERNVGLLKQYTADEYRLVHMRTLRLPGFEELGSDGKGKKGSAGNTAKLSQSLSRSKSRVWELSLCNPWEYFVTLTIDASKFNRYDLNAYQKKLSKWLNNYNSRRNLSVQYLLVPEPHKDSAWHIHGLFMGLPLEELTAFTLQDHIPERIKGLLHSGRRIYNWTAYAESFGWVTVEPILDHDRCAAYMTKYITKQLLDSSISLNHHVYYASQGLVRAQLVHRGEIRQNFPPDFENDYVRIKRFNSLEEPLLYFCDKEDEEPYG